MKNLGFIFTISIIMLFCGLFCFGMIHLEKSAEKHDLATRVTSIEYAKVAKRTDVPTRPHQVDNVPEQRKYKYLINKKEYVSVSQYKTGDSVLVLHYLDSINKETSYELRRL